MFIDDHICPVMDGFHNHNYTSIGIVCIYYLTQRFNLAVQPIGVQRCQGWVGARTTSAHSQCQVSKY